MLTDLLCIVVSIIGGIGFVGFLMTGSAVGGLIVIVLTLVIILRMPMKKLDAR